MLLLRRITRVRSTGREQMMLRQRFTKLTVEPDPVGTEDSGQLFVHRDHASRTAGCFGSAHGYHTVQEVHLVPGEGQDFTAPHPRQQGDTNDCGQERRLAHRKGGKQSVLFVR